MSRSAPNQVFSIFILFGQETEDISYFINSESSSDVCNRALVMVSHLLLPFKLNLTTLSFVKSIALEPVSRRKLI